MLREQASVYGGHPEFGLHLLTDGVIEGVRLCPAPLTLNLEISPGVALALCIPSALVQQLELPLFSRPAAIRVGGLSDPPAPGSWARSIIMAEDQSNPENRKGDVGVES